VTNEVLAKSLEGYLTISIDIQGELVVLAILLSAVIIPQILSFLVSGILGCGTSPVLVSKVSKFAIISLVKFFCIFAALEMAGYLYQLFAYPVEHDWDNWMTPGVDQRVGTSFILLSSSFIVSTVYSKYDTAIKYIEDRPVIRSLGDLWGRMTKYTDEDESEDSEHLLNEKLEAYRDLVDLGLFITSLARLSYRIARRAAGKTKAFEEALSICRQLLKERSADAFARRMASLIVALWYGRKPTNE
jgi:hypothetical protein